MRTCCFIAVTLSAIWASSFGGTITFHDNTQIDSAQLGAVRVNLLLEEDLLVPSTRGKNYLLEQVDPAMLSPEAINEILRRISALYQERGILATRAVVTKGAYFRARDGGDLEIRIQEGRITKTRFVPAEGKHSIDAGKVDRIREWAPLGAGDVVDSDRLDKTLGQVNRFSRQIVRPVLLPDQGGAILEYRVKQLDEWQAGYTLDNYGTERTGKTRHLLDLNKWNLFTVDDHLQLNGTVSTEGNAWLARGNYTVPLSELSIDRLKISTYTSIYSAQDVGLGSTGIEFEGESYGAIGTYERTLWNDNGAYLDGSVGVHFLNAMQDQSTLGVPSARTHYLLPFVGLRYTKSGIDTSWTVGAKLEGNLAQVAGTDTGVDLNLQGRLNASEDFLLGHVYAGYRTFLDSLLGSTGKRVHEISFFGSATSSLGGDRVPPSFLSVMGGPYSVRGYPIGLLSGDHSAYLKTDYKIHLNRLGGIGSVDEGNGAGQIVPRFPGDMPDFDAALGVFFDIGSVSNENRLGAFEQDGTISSVGLGVSLNYKDNYRFTIEHAWALTDIVTPNDVVNSGDGETYLKFSAKW